jgi:hypothetical protein
MSLTNSEILLRSLRQAWSVSVSKVNILLLAVICISVPTACGMKWLNIKKISREREERKMELEGVTGDLNRAEKDTSGHLVE